MKTILVPTDFSANAINAMKYAIQLAEKLNSNLIFYHSTNIPLRVELFGLSKKEMKDIERNNIDEKAALLDISLNKLYRQLQIPRDALRVQVLVENGVLVVEDVINAARKYKVDMIVAGTHGATGIRKLFGSITSILISKSDTPVLAIPPKYRFRPIKKILYASDLKSPLTEIKSIVPLAESFGSAIDVFNLSYTGSGNDEKLFKKLTGGTHYVNLRLVQVKRNPGETVLQQLREFLDFRKPDILVMFPERKSFFQNIFEGSKTEKLSFNLKMPLLSIKKK